jgi:hypothetical protein
MFDANQIRFRRTLRAIDADQGGRRCSRHAAHMSATGLSVFDTTLQKTNHWLKELMRLLDWHDRQKAYLALRSTLHALRDRLTVEETAQLAAQLPT